MMKDKKNVGIIVLITIVMTLLIILMTKMLLRNENKQKANSNVSIGQNQFENQINSANTMQNQQSDSILSNEEKKAGMNELNQMMKNKTDKCKVIVNGEKITEREIAFANFQYNNSIINKNEKKIDAQDEIVKEYLIAQNAQEKGIGLSEKESKAIEDRIKGKNEKDNKELEEIASIVNMQYDEFVEFYIKRRKRLEIQTKWSLYITDAIKSGELKTENNVFNKKCEEYRRYSQSEETLSKAVSLMFELIDEYKEMLKQKANIEYIN